MQGCPALLGAALWLLPETGGCRITLTLPGGLTQTGFFAINFTWAEIRTLEARQALPFRAQNTATGHRCVVSQSATRLPGLLPARVLAYPLTVGAPARTQAMPGQTAAHTHTQLVREMSRCCVALWEHLQLTDCWISGDVRTSQDGNTDVCYRLVTVEEALLLAQTRYTGPGGAGVYIETKAPAFHRHVFVHPASWKAERTWFRGQRLSQPRQLLPV